MEPGDGQSIAQHADVKCLEEQMDQNDDRHPRYRVPMMIRFLSLRSGDNLSCCTSARPCRRSAIMGASPELFHEVDGSRIAAVLCFLRSLATIAPTRARWPLSVIRPSRIARRSMNNLVQNNAVTAICCPCSDVKFVQLNFENRTMDFVPRFSNMHGSVESHATR